MKTKPYICPLNIELVHPGDPETLGSIQCRIDEHVKFDAEGLQSYESDAWRPIIYDAMLVAAAVEICDHTRPRAKMDWARDFTVSVPVHDPALWQQPSVTTSLLNALKMLTGDNWRFEFKLTSVPQEGPKQKHFGFPQTVSNVVPYSDGLDSRCVTEIMSRSQDEQIIRVRVGPSKIVKPKIGEAVQPFANVPFKVKKIKRGNGESSGRSRGFKFAMLSGLAAYLTGADSIVVPESGQGTLGPVLVNVGQAHFDRRTHPQFTVLMSSFFEALLGKHIRFKHPMIWGTKGESLQAFKALKPGDEIWRETRSCWKDQRQASVNREHRQCGVCAACILRRTSLHSAGYHESSSMYIWENLSADEFWSGAHRDHKNDSSAQRDYAIAGVLHMDHLAALRIAHDRDLLIQRQALVLATCFETTFDEAFHQIVRLIDAHAEEWSGFVRSFPRNSFLREWAKAA